MSDIHSYSILGTVLLTSIWSLVCLKKNDPLTADILTTNGTQIYSSSSISATGVLSMQPPIEQLKAADF